MRIRITIAVASTMAMLAGCGASTSQQQAARPDHQCAALGDVSAQVADMYTNKVTAVKPVHKKDFIARAIQPKYIAGAELYVVGEQGMNEAYLDRVLSCHAASGKPAAHPNDPTRAGAIDRIAVDSAGSNYRITITGADRAAGNAIWRSAQTLERGGSVSVQQLAASTPAPDAL